MAEINRMWIDQPSTLQKFHNLHGTLVLAERENKTTWRVWFLTGDIISQQFPLGILSDGWPIHLRS